MKTILLFSLICFTLSVWGPVDKIKNSNTEDVCDPLTATANSLSDCVDLNLKVEIDGKTRYVDRCCYVRYQDDGEIINMCVPIREQEYLDITESIKGFEKECSSHNAEGKDCKVYQFDCSASNIKFLSFAIILLALLF